MARGQNKADKLLGNDQLIAYSTSTPDMSRIVLLVQKVVVYEVVRHGGHRLFRREGCTRITMVAKVGIEFYFWSRFEFHGFNGHETIDGSSVRGTNEQIRVSHGCCK